jgi:hypothetical protein
MEPRVIEEEIKISRKYLTTKKKPLKRPQYKDHINRPLRCNR